MEGNRRNKKILLITPFYNGIGGVETSLKTLVTMLTKRGYEVRVCTLKVPPKLFERFEGHPFLQFLHLVPRLWFKALFLYFLFRPSVVHAAGIAASWAARFIPCPYVVSTHAIYSGIYKLSPLHKWPLRGAKRVLCLTKASEKEIGLPNCVGYTTLVDIDMFKPLPPRAIICGGDTVASWNKFIKPKIKFIILFVGRPIKKKGYDVLKKAVEGLDVNLVYCNNVPNEQLPYYYNKADLTVVPSQYKECCSRVVIESLLCGTPVVYSCFDSIEIKDSIFARSVTPDITGLKHTIHIYKEYICPSISKEEVREFALKYFGKENLDVFIDAYNL